MHTFIKKTTRLAVALMIPTLFLMSCSDDMVEPDNATPPKGQIVKPR